MKMMLDLYNRIGQKRAIIDMKTTIETNSKQYRTKLLSLLPLKELMSTKF
jgi:hypothetical protein